MDSIVSYRSDDEQDSDSEYKSRESNSAHSNNSHNSGSHSKRTTKEKVEKDKRSPDRRRKESKADSSSTDRNSTQRLKNDRHENRERSRDDTERSRKENERSKSDRERPRENRDRPYDSRRHEARDREERRRDRQPDRHYKSRDNRGRNDRDRRHWRSRSSSRERYANPDSPGDKRDKDRKRYSSQTNSSQDKSSISSNRNPPSHSQDFGYSQGKSAREYDRVSDQNRDQHASCSTSKDTPHQSVASTTTIEFEHQQKPSESSSALPSYYNPSVMNPNRYAEQVQKRKLLWGNKKSEETVKKWGNAKFAQDTDGKVASKFMRLMGIKDKPKPGEEPPTSTVTTGSEIINKQEEMFSSMEQQYEVARQATHTMRGVGLGFSSQARPF